MKFLVFNRPFTKSFTLGYRSVIFPGDELRYVSDFKYRDDVGLIERQYTLLKGGDGTRLQTAIIDCDLIICRCRYLRNIDQSLAVRLVRSAYLAINDILDEYVPDVYVGLPIDNYYLHLFHLICDCRGIVNVSPVQSFLPDRTRITSMGEYIGCRTVSTEEVDGYYDLLTRANFKPVWLNKHRSIQKLIRLYVKERLKKIYFTFAKLAKRDPYSFHYNTIFPAKGVITIGSLGNVFAYRKFQSFDATKRLFEDLKGKKKLVYLPLQFSPETTIDYYIDDYRFGRYEELIGTVLKGIPDNVVLVVKEHPDLYGFRGREFYDKFVSNERVHLCSVNFPTSEILRNIDAVVVTGGGSTGAEAIVRGIPTVSLGACFYSGPESLSIERFDLVHEWSKVIFMERPTVLQRKAVVRRVLENTLEGPYDFVRSSSSDFLRNVDNVKRIVEWLRGKLN